MNRVIEIDPARPNGSRAALAAAARALAEGHLVVFPTETVYGVASRPDDPAATARLFAAKQRPLGLNLPVLAAAAGQAWELGVPDDRAVRLAGAFWPGPLTMVVPRADPSRAWGLGEHRDSIALRVPDHPLSSALIGVAGPLAVTSANLSGRAPLSHRDDLVRAFGESVAVYLMPPPGAALPSGTPSTVVDLTGPTMRILRPGPISTQRMEAVIADG